MRFNLIIICLFGVLSVTPAQEAFTSLRGQVTEDTALEQNLYPVEGVHVMLDLVPDGEDPDGVPDFTEESGPFGFYTFTNTPAGTYRLTASHPAYEDYPAPEDAPLDLVLAEDVRETQAIKLVPKYDPGTFFDVYFQVNCAQSNWEMPGCPVRVQRYADEAGTQLLYDRTLQVNSDGVAVFRGVQPGYYRFMANQNGVQGYRNKWDSYSTQGQSNDLVEIDHPYMAHIYLKPVEQQLTVQVGGLKLNTEAPFYGPSSGPLKDIYVILEGVDPEDSGLVLIPARTGVTDENGEVTFQGLPGISYRARGRRLGYYETPISIDADANGTLPSGAVPLSLQYYDDPDLLLPVVNDVSEFPVNGTHLVVAAVIADELTIRVFGKSAEPPYYDITEDQITPGGYLDYVKGQIASLAGLPLTSQQKSWILGDLSGLTGVDLSQMDIHLHVIFDPGYSETFLPTYYLKTGSIGLRLSGIKFSNTEGLVRVPPGMLMGSPGTVFEEGTAWFNYLVPGRYRIEHKGLVREEYSHFAQPGLYTEDFYAKAYGEAIVEVPCISDDDDTGTVDGRHHSVTLQTTYQPVEVRGRLYAADTLADPGGQPVYLPLAEKVVKFIEHDGVEILRAEDKEVTATTDEQGYFHADLPPSIYGISVDGVTNYMGRSIVVTPLVSDETSAIGIPVERKWPLHEVVPEGFNLSCFSDFYDTRGLAVGKHDSISIDLYLKKELYCYDSKIYESDLPLAIYYDPAAHSFGTAPYSDLFKAATRIDLEPTGAGSTVGGAFRYGEGDKIVGWSNIAAGTYSPVIEHPRYSFDYQTGTGAALNSILFVDHPDPGKAPTQALVDQVGTQEKVYYEPLSIPDHEQTRFYTTGAGPTTGTQSADIYVWNETYERYDFLRNRTADLIAVDFLPGVYLPGSSGPGSATDAWVSVDYNSERYWFNFAPGASPADIYINDATPTGSPPELNYDLSVRTVLKQDRTQGVGGVHFMYAGGTGSNTVTSTNSPYTYTELNRTNTPFIAKDTRTADDWLWEDASGSSLKPNVTISGGQPQVEYTVPVDQGMQVKVQLRGYGDQPLPSVSLELLASNGAVLGSGEGSTYRVRTSTNGVAIFNALPGMRDYFLRVNVPGYRPALRRLDMEDALDVRNDPAYPSTSYLHDLTAEGNTLDIVLLDRPELDMMDGELVPFNRYGAFLPGVTRAGNQDLFDSDVTQLNGYSAEEVLTAIWEVEVTRKTHEYSLPGFDLPNGSEGSPVDVTAVDDILEVWLVDKRVFEGDYYTNTASTLDFPLVTNPAGVIEKLKSLRTPGSGGTRPLTYFTRATTIEPISGDLFKASGELKLWTLPPGDFRPLFVVVTRMGAVTILEIDYPADPENAVTQTRLTGVPIPSWLGFAFDVIGFAGGVAATQEEIESFVPDGKFIPLPEFSAEIGLHEEDEEETKYIDYNYQLQIWQREGQDAPPDNLVGLAAGIVGAEWEIGAAISMPGKDRKLELSIDGQIEMDVGGDDDDLAEEAGAYKPKILGGRKLIDDSEVKLSGTVHTAAMKNVNSSEPWDVRLNNVVNVNVDTEFKMNLQPILGKIPYIGPVLTTLDKMDLAQFFAVAEAGASLGTQFCWETIKPVRYTTETDPTDPRVARRHFLGGKQAEGTGDPDFDAFSYVLCFRFGAGLLAQCGDDGDIAGASGFLRLTGDGCNGGSGPPSVQVEPNTLGDWPPIKRIWGKATADMEAYLKTPIYDFEKSWSWDLMEFDAQYGTESVFQLIPMTIHQETTGPDEFGESEFTGDALVPVRAFMPVSAYAAGAPEGGAARLLYPDYDSQNGVMRLMVSVRDVNGQWLTPDEIDTGAVIMRPQMLELPDGRLLVVWIAIAEEDKNDPFATAQLAYSIYNPLLSTWTTPAQIAPVDSVPSSIYLARSGDLIALIVVERAGGPASGTSQLYAASFNGATWSGLTACGGEQSVFDVAVATDGDAGAGEVHIHFVNREHKVHYYRWNGTTVSGPLPVDASSTFGSIASVASGDAGYKLAAMVDEYGITSYSASAPAAPYVRQQASGVPGSGGNLVAVRLPHAGTNVVLLVWIEPAMDGSALVYAFTDEQGSLLQGPVPLTGNEWGRYTQLTVLAESNRTGRVMAIFENDTPELRSFSVSYDTGLSGNDSDNDQMNDIIELLVVDALPSRTEPADAITTVAQVLPGDDFDQDGFSNKTEADAGTDLTDPTSYPEPGGVFVTANNPVACELANAPGSFIIERPGGDTSQTLTVNYSLSGSAGNGVDFVTLPLARTIAANSTTTGVSVIPISDTLPEGDETVTLTILDDPSYTVGLPASATVTIKDLPIDAWRMEHFPGDPQGADAQYMADPENDGIVNLLEYALFLDPGVKDILSMTEGSIYRHTDGKDYLMLTYLRNQSAVDLIYTVQICDDLDAGTWESGAGETVEVTGLSPATDEYGNPYVRIRTVLSIDESIKNHKFMRLRVSIAP